MTDRKTYWLTCLLDGNDWNLWSKRKETRKALVGNFAAISAAAIPAERFLSGAIKINGDYYIRQPDAPSWVYNNIHRNLIKYLE